MKKIKYVSFLLYLIVKSTGHPVSNLESEDLLETGNFRVKRQAGYVYEKPNLPFDLPTQAPTVSTQGPTVDRTQAQMMYYAYPAPSAGSNVVNSGGPSRSDGTATASGSAGSIGGYNYEAKNTASGAQSLPGSSSQSSGGSSGYGYNAPSAGTTSTGSAQSSGSASSAGYGYQAPSAGAGAANTNQSPSVSVQTTNTGSSQTATNSGSVSGYDYNAPATSAPSPGVDVSTNAPKYLPPLSGGLNSNGVSSGSNSKGYASSNALSGGSVIPEPLDQYLPPVVSQPRPSPPPIDQYLPPLTQPRSPASSVPSGPSLNVGVQASPGSGPSASYVPPNIPPVKATPRPFEPAIQPTGYLPPNINPQTPSNSAITPASSYLPPVLK